MALGPKASATIETLTLRVLALLVGLALFGVFVACAKANPFEVFSLMYQGSFGSWFSFQNTLQRAAPLILTALCTALPARLGLVVIGAEGALVVGAVAAAAAALLVQSFSPFYVLTVMALCGALAGGMWIALVGGLRHYRGVNETICSLLLNYIAIALMNHFVEGPLRDPQSLNKPATLPIGDDNMMGNIPGLDVHWGLLFGVIFCLVSYFVLQHTTFGYSVRVTGGNVRAARIVGLPVGLIILIVSFVAGAAAGLAGMVEVAAIHGNANASIVCGYGYAGILVAFIARQNPIAILPVALLLGGINASSGLLQRRVALPDATVLVLQGILFVVILASETLFGRLAIFQPKTETEKPKSVPPTPQPALVIPEGAAHG